MIYSIKIIFVFNKKQAGAATYKMLFSFIKNKFRTSLYYYILRKICTIRTVLFIFGFSVYFTKIIV